MLTKMLAVYSSVLATLVAAMVFSAKTAAASKLQNLDEINVHRINVREPDGTLRMVVSDHALLPGVI